MAALSTNRHARRATAKKQNMPKGAHKSLIIASALLLSATWINVANAADILPTGGAVVAGAGTISQSAGAMTINQSTDKMAINWQSYSVGQGNSVTYNQPSSSSIALNRVLGSDVSVIQGKITANGQVFLINPNGVLFSPTAQVNVGGLVASTLSMKTEDFMAGKLTFEGASSNAVINQGNITAAKGGTIALIAAKIVNEGTITAEAGNVLMGAGSKVTLDMGGPVKIEVEQGALDALITQGGAIKADGGLVYLTAKAANALVTTVINNTGIIEAQTLSTGETGKIVLLGTGDTSAIKVGGTLDASAPNGGNGGFIETSAKIVSFADDLKVAANSAKGVAGTWLIDPTNITIDANSCTGTNCIAANTIQSTLNGSTNVTIQTDSVGSDAGDITVNAPITWNAGLLSFIAANDILINQTLTASGAGKLGLAYGQGTTDGAGSTYTVASNAKIYVPDSASFLWKKGSAGATKYLVFNNGYLRFGNGTDGSIDGNGQLKQPFYFDNTSVVNGVTRNGWFKLTYQTYPLDLQLAEGGDGTNAWNTNGTILSTAAGTLTSAITSKSLEISGYKEGTGSVLSTINLDFGSGTTLRVDNTYTLLTNAYYLKTDTSITNTSASSVGNLRLWVGTKDDWVANSDSNFKYKGNITANGFTAITDPTTQAKALEIAERSDGQGAAILFYSTSADANTIIGDSYGWNYVASVNPTTSPVSTPQATDGSYALFMRLSDMTPGASGGMTWYYAAAPVAELSNVVQDVGVSAGVTPAPTPAPRPVLPPATTSPLVAAVETAQTQAAVQTTAASITTTPATVAASIAAAAAPVSIGASTAGAINIGSLHVVEVSAPITTQSESGSSNQQSGEPIGERHSSGDSLTQVAQESSAAGFLKVFVVNGGVNIPEDEQTR